MASIEAQLVQDLAVILITASLVTYAFNKLKQPVVLGYIIAGIIIGPYTPPYSLISGPSIISALAQIGVILLLFGVGLEFPLSILRSLGRPILIITAFEVAIMMAVGLGVGEAFKFSLLESLFLGAALSSSSTTIIAKVLRDLGKIREQSSAIMLGVLVVEDLVVVILLVALQAIATVGQISYLQLLELAAKISIFLFAAILVGVKLVAPFMKRIAYESRELIIISAAGICFAFSISAYLIGFSVAIGAFLSGVVIAGVKESGAIAQVVEPLRDLFGAIFFVSVGALMDISGVLTFLIPAIVVTLGMVGGKMFGCSLGTLVSGFKSSTALKVGLGMAQIGEFAFIVMALGTEIGVVSSSLYTIVGIAVLITAFLTPYLIRYSSRFGNNQDVLPATPSSD